MNAVLITGASSGIGECFAKSCASQGKNLVVVARNEEKLFDLKKELEEKNKITVTVIKADLSNANAAEEVFRITQSNNIFVEMLINNAGFSTKGLFHKDDFETMENEMNVNMLALTKLSYFYVNEMVEKKKGMVINIASAVSFNPLPYGAVYSATKSYVLALTEALYYEYKDMGIKFLAVCPGATDTHFFDKIGRMKGELRKPEDVVNTTWRAVAKKKIVVCDGVMSKLQSFMPKILPMKKRVAITGRVGKNTWGI